MNKSFLKFLTDFGPLVIFFYYYYDSGKDLKIAIPPFIIATILALAIMWFLEKKIPKVPLLSGVLITFFGGLTIYFNNPVFIYIKPTIINILFGIALLFGKLLITKAEEDSIYVSDDQVEFELERRMRFFISQFGSQEKMEKFYGKSMFYWFRGNGLPNGRSFVKSR